ncbi:hypothetical protein GCM10023084_80390 [Streptomyces lacrimifluminis]|uniref:Uncharacterized protein n=1 Tax=Streptomyces lacrimifluminis TaxID=1500077 RepID=A0A917PCA5_9ACTN|nr:hypothetical protein GCM10012282_79330 [Streptomyces lacrimifluminis]
MPALGVAAWAGAVSVAAPRARVRVRAVVVAVAILLFLRMRKQPLRGSRLSGGLSRVIVDSDYPLDSGQGAGVVPETRITVNAIDSLRIAAGRSPFREPRSLSPARAVSSIASRRRRDRLIDLAAEIWRPLAETPKQP